MTQTTHKYNSIPDKVFVDSNEDINFVIEKILTSEHSRIILIVPQHAVLVSSTINLKLLARQLAQNDKVVVLVTSNELASNKTASTNIIAVRKAEEIDPSVWDNAETLISDLKHSRDQLKNQLIKSRSESVDEPVVSQMEVPKTEYKREEPVQPIVKRDRQKSKVVQIGKFTMMGAGDVSKNAIAAAGAAGAASTAASLGGTVSAAAAAPITVSSYNSKQNSYETPEANTNQPTPVVFNPTNTNNFQSRAAQTKQPSKAMGGSKWIKIIALIVILAGIGIYFANTKFNSSTLTIETDIETIAFSETVNANTSINTVDEGDKAIPLRKITQKVSGSDSAPSTGEAETGDKATGVVDFLNKTDQDITLNAGQEIVTLSGNLVFTLSETIKIPKRISEITPSTYTDAPITAKEHGEKYNISGVDVKIGSYDTINQLSGRIYRKTSGGSSRTVKVVSQKDIDDLKNKLTEDLKKQAQEEVDKQITDEDIRIEGFDDIKETKFEVSAKANDEANSFDIGSLEYEMTAFIIKKADLEELSEKLIMEKYKLEDVELIKDSESSKIETPKAVGDDKNEVEFKLTKEVDLPTQVDQSELLASIKGKRVSEVGSIVASNDAITDYSISNSIPFIPSFLRTIPTDETKINIVFKSE